MEVRLGGVDDDVEGVVERLGGAEVVSVRSDGIGEGVGELTLGLE